MKSKIYNFQELDFKKLQKLADLVFNKYIPVEPQINIKAGPANVATSRKSFEKQLNQRAANISLMQMYFNQANKRIFSLVMDQERKSANMTVEMEKDLQEKIFNEIENLLSFSEIKPEKKEVSAGKNPEPDHVQDLEKLTKKELIEMAAARGKDISPKLKKADILKILLD